MATTQFAEAPKGLKQLRACVGCRIIKTNAQWRASVCENCSADDTHNLSSAGARLDWMLNNTNEQFVGTVAMANPERSWVAKWTQMHRITADGRRVAFVPGVYAVEVPQLLSGGGGDAEDRYDDEAADGDEGEMADFIADEDDDEGEFDAPASAGASAGAGAAGAAPRLGTAALNDDYDSEDDGDYEAAPGDAESDGEGTSSDSDDGDVRHVQASSGVGVGGALEDDDDSD